MTTGQSIQEPSGAYRSDWISTRAALDPGAIALIDGHSGERLRYGQLRERIDQTARALAAHGVERGDRVGVASRNRFEVIDLVFACAKLGAIFTGFNWRLAAPELRAQLSTTEPRLVLVEAEFVSGFDGGGVGATRLDLDAFAAECRAADSSPLPTVPTRDTDPWVLCFTGGTTGRAKAAVLTRRSIQANALATVCGWGLGSDDVAILDAPLFHTGGLNVFTTPLLLAGGTSIVRRHFEPGFFFEALGSELPPTVLFGVPTMLQRLTEHPGWASADLSGVRLVVTGGAPAPRAVFERFAAKGLRLRLGYGLTEAGPNNFGIPADWLAAGDPRGDAHWQSVGVPLPGVDVRLVDDLGEPVVTGPGRLQLRGNHVMNGYFRDPDATAAAIDADGWLDTGDLASRDGAGRYRIVGRSKNVVISGGENVYPAEVEAALLASPEVREAAVFGVPDDQWGERVVAVVVWNGTPDTRALLTGLRERLAGYKVPRQVVGCDALPLTGAGKVDRRALQALVHAAAIESSTGERR